MTGLSAIYARCSSDRQQDRSIDDQVLLCRAYCIKNDLNVTAVYEDRARSGASTIGRDGLMKMLHAARDKAFDVAIVEALV
jgi:site-specific DNA recombinase